jgi:hypothetical protein
VTANLKFINEISLFLSFFTMFYIKNKITKDSYSRSKNLTAPFAENKHVQSFTFSTPTQPRLSFERMIVIIFAKESSVNVQRTNTKIVGVLQGSTLGPERTIHTDSSKQQIQQVQIRFSLALWKTHIVV